MEPHFFRSPAELRRWFAVRAKQDATRRARLDRLIAQWTRGEVGRELVLRPRQA